MKTVWRASAVVVALAATMACRESQDDALAALVPSGIEATIIDELIHSGVINACTAAKAARSSRFASPAKARACS